MNNWKVIALAFIDDFGKVLLNHRIDTRSVGDGFWELVGGTIEKDELPEIAMVREVYEEVGYKLDEVTDELRFVKKYEFANKDRFYEVYFFIAKFPGFDALSDSDEVKVVDLKLYSVEQALQLPLLPVTKLILEEGSDLWSMKS